MKKILPAALLLLTAQPVFAQVQTAWTNTFTIEIFSRPLPEIPENTLAITVVKGSTAGGSITLENNGNQPVGFTAIRSPSIPPSSMDANWTAMRGWVNFTNPDREAPGLSNIALGFTFPFLSANYTAVTLDASLGIVRFSPTSPLLILQIFNPAASENVQYKLETDRLVAQWKDATSGQLKDLNFQVHLYKNGEVRYLYQSMGGAQVSDATIGYLFGSLNLLGNSPADDSTTPLAPGSMLVLTPTFWIDATDTGSVPAGSTAQLIFTADATGTDAVSGSYDFIVTWSDGTEETVTVDVTVQNQMPELDILPATVNLTGPSGTLVKGTAVLSNTGNVDVNYAFAYPAAAKTANYTWIHNSSFNWNETAGTEFVVPAEFRNSGFHELMPLGFAFPYFGTYYTNFSISVDGFVSLGATGPTANQIIAPYMGNLYYDNNSRIRTSGDRRVRVVTWENMKDEDGKDQTFQLILESNGTMTFQYLELNGTNSWIKSNIANTITYLTNPTRPKATGIGLKDTGSRISNQTLIWSPGPDDDRGTVTTSIVVTQETIPDPNRDYGTKTILVTNQVVVYDDPLLNHAFSFVPAAVPITVSPVTGTLAPGETQEITIIGDARGLAVNKTISATYNVLGGASTKPLKVNLKATAPLASAELASPAESALQDSDGDGQSDLAEILAGTDELNADSAFKANMDGSRTITWTEPSGSGEINRTYTIWFTTNLLDGWQKLAEVTNGTSFTDEEHNDVPAIYYKVTVQ